MLKHKRYRDQLDIRSPSRNQLEEIDEEKSAVFSKTTPGRILVVEDDEKDLKLLI